MAMTFDERQQRARTLDEAKKQYPDLFRVPDVPLSPEEFQRQHRQVFDQDVLAQFKTTGTFKARGKEWPRPTDEVIKDLQSNRHPQGEPMKLFTFATTKPPAATIWKTLMESDIQPSDGLSVMQIRYLIFHYFQESSDFEAVKAIINVKLSYSQKPGVWNDCRVVLSDLRKVITDIPDHFPSWVGDDLYVPYYMAKQLGHSVQWDMRAIDDIEHLHLSVDADDNDIRYTAYKLWRFAPNLLQFFSIDMSLSPITVADRDHLVAILRAEIDSTLASNHDHIIRIADKITIPPFVLGVTDEA